MASSEFDTADPEEFYAEFERRARERRERRAGRRRGHKRHAKRQRALSPEGSLTGTGAQTLIATPAGRALIAAVAALAVATIAGLLILWPYSSPHEHTPGLAHAVKAKALRSSTTACEEASGVSCRQLEISVAGRRSQVMLGPLATAPAVSPGTPVLVSPVALPHGSPALPGYEPWQFVDVDRTTSLLWILGALLVVALVVIRLRGLLAALGVGLSLLLMTKFLIPALLAGEPALWVALVCALAVMFITLILTNGLGAQTLAGALGIGLTLLLICGLGELALHMAHIDGRTDELSTYLGTLNHGISLQGIVMAGMLVGALGVLADTAVTQASAVMALRRADPQLSPRELYRGAFLVGRDHLSATIHTLVLAYVGASLPLLLITHATGVGLTEAISTQEIAEPVLATLVGCIGLVCAVPLTTALAALLVARVPPRALTQAHAHHHH